MATELTSAALARNASERDLDYISTCIGGNWEMLAPFLISKIPTATVEQIKEDHRKCQQRVFNLLLTWWRETDDPSLAHLFHLMYKAGTSVTIEWQHIAKLLEVQLRDIRACKTDYKPRVQELHAGQGKDTFLYSCKFDGRLIQLDKAQIKRLESTLDKEPIGEGGIGVVYRSSKYCSL